MTRNGVPWIPSKSKTRTIWCAGHGRSLAQRSTPPGRIGRYPSASVHSETGEVLVVVRAYRVEVSLGFPKPLQSPCGPLFLIPLGQQTSASNPLLDVKKP